MTHFPTRLVALLADESGQDLVEYALVACLVGLGAVVAVKGMGSKVAAAFTFMNSTLSSNI